MIRHLCRHKNVLDQCQSTLIECELKYFVNIVVMHAYVLCECMVVTYISLQFDNRRNDELLVIPRSFHKIPWMQGKELHEEGSHVLWPT